MRSREITRAVKLCDQKGKLNEESIGWARQPMVYCNVRGSFLRKKKWNYWCMTSREAVFSITVSHLDYAAVIFAYIVDLNEKTYEEQSILLPLGKKVQIPDNVAEPIHFDYKGIRIHIKDVKDTTRLYVHWPNFNEGQALDANFTINKVTEQESLNVTIPWRKSRFQFTSKQVALPSKGEVSWSKGLYHFTGQQSFATLDFGRGKWPYQSKWNWGAASGYSDGYRVGLNFGGQWTVGTGQNENGIILDYKLHKIHGELEWIYDPHDYMKPWVIHTLENKQVKLMFEPIFERVTKTNIGVVKSSVHQVFGYYSGTIETEGSQNLQLERIFGWAEDHEARW
ncbi:DUF2804 domain-containing protein [Piscibacillus sp. B03]|uniref:DUF2804 domain-containing protein n=1 Tax=Piscibacillus sp. B03 TaxID=3457430 RepID=UPI003FCDD4B8